MHVAIFGPAHIACRIIETTFFVIAVVTARAVRARNKEVDLLGVDIGAIEAYRHVADQYNSAFATAHAQRRAQKFVRCRRRCDDNRIGAKPAGQARRLLFGIVAAIDGEVHSVLTCLRNPRRVEIGADHPDAGCLQQTHRELAKDAKPNDHKGLAHRRGSSPDTLQRDGAKCDGGREFVGDAIGRWHDQISRHADIFGMERRLSTGARHAISGKQIVDALSNREHRAGERVTHRLRLREV